VRALGEAAGLLLGMHLVELAAGRSPMPFVGVVRERGKPKFDIVVIPDEEWSSANSASWKDGVEAAAWLLTDADDHELNLYVMRIPKSEFEFDVIMDIQYARDENGRLAISKPRFRGPPDGDEAQIESLWAGINEGMSNTDDLEAANVAFGGLGGYADDDDDADDDADED